MGREKRTLPAALVGGPKEKHRRAQRSQYDPKAPVPNGFVAKPSVPKSTSKYQSYFELVENTDKKKKLEFQVTGKKSPPPGFEFVPIGNPELTSACKELSREKDAMIFIVSNAKDAASNNLSHQVHRIGHHIRQTIVEEARGYIRQPADTTAQITDGQPEPIPELQTEYNLQVDAAIRDLFPRIPNTDRQAIIEHAFQRGATFKGEKPVGLSEDITLARRVQLAVLAHIRHNHTRYDDLLKETSWQNARKVVESLCLDILVKWRGDEETGRDQLDEILREVVIISDSEDEDSEQETDTTSMEDVIVNEQQLSAGHLPQVPRQAHPISPAAPSYVHEAPPDGRPNPATRMAVPSRAADKRGFKRYRAWKEAIRRVQDVDSRPQGNVGSGYYHPGSLGPISAPSHIHPDASGSRFMNGSTGFPSNNPQPSGFGDVAARSLPLLDPGMPPQPARLQVNTASYEHPPPSERAGRQPISPITHGFQDLLVRSIEPASPDAPQSYYIRTLPPRGHGSAPHSPMSTLPHVSTRPISPPRDFRPGPAPPYLGRRVVSDHIPHEVGRHNDTMMISTNGSDTARNQYGVPSRYMEQPHTYLPVIHSGSHVPVTNPSKRIIIDAPRPGERSNPILMENRGGFYERVPVSSDANPAASMPAFVQIRRAEPEYDRVPQHLIRRAQEPEPNLEANRGYHPRAGPHGSERDARADHYDPSFPHLAPQQPPRAPPHVYEDPMAQHDTSKGWVPRRPEDSYYRGRMQTGFEPGPRAEYVAPVPQQVWADRPIPGATGDNYGRQETFPHSFQTINHHPRNGYNDVTRHQHGPLEPEHVIVLD